MVLSSRPYFISLRSSSVLVPSTRRGIVDRLGRSWIFDPHPRLQPRTSHLSAQAVRFTSPSTNEQWDSLSSWSTQNAYGCVCAAVMSLPAQHCRKNNVLVQTRIKALPSIIPPCPWHVGLVFTWKSDQTLPEIFREKSDTHLFIFTRVQPSGTNNSTRHFYHMIWQAKGITSLPPNSKPSWKHGRAERCA